MFSWRGTGCLDDVYKAAENWFDDDLDDNSSKGGKKNKKKQKNEQMLQITSTAF